MLCTWNLYNIVNQLYLKKREVGTVCGCCRLYISLNENSPQMEWAPKWGGKIPQAVARYQGHHNGASNHGWMVGDSQFNRERWGWNLGEPSNAIWVDPLDAKLFHTHT